MHEADGNKPLLPLRHPSSSGFWLRFLKNRF